MTKCKENRWVLTNNDNKQEFSDFKEAKVAFRNSIKEAMNDKDAYPRGEPFSLGVYFSSKFNDGSISDSEIVIYNRAQMLIDSIYASRTIDYKNDKCLYKNIIPKYFFYSGSNDLGEDAFISIDKNEDEILLCIIVNDNDDINMLYTNAFVMDSKERVYCFTSRERISTSDNPDKLGEILYSNITLKKEIVSIDEGQS